MARFIVIDGLDGCGKATQTELLKQALEKMGKKVVKISFPDYDSDSSAPVKMYLSGKLGSDPELLNPYMCGSFYAVDRFIQYVTDWKKYFDEDNNTVIIADRYLSANIIHQGGKIENKAEREKYIKWCYEYESNLCGLPKEDVTILLTVLPEVSQKLMTDRYNGDEQKKDIHESNLSYLNDCYDRLKYTCEYIKENNIANWVSIDCTEYSSDNNNLTIKDIDTIHAEVMECIKGII